MAHDFKRFPELTNRQMKFYYLDSPHQQIVNDFEATVVKVIDGDTLKLRADFRDFDFELRIIGIDSKELSEGGDEAKEFLRGQIEGELVQIIMSPQRTEKWGRLLGDARHLGQLISKLMLLHGYAVKFENRHKGKLPNHRIRYSLTVC